MEEFLPGSTWIEMKSFFYYFPEHLSGRVTGRADVRIYSWQPRWLTGKKIGRWARRVPPFQMDKTQYKSASLSVRASLGHGNIDTDVFCSTIWTLTLLNVHFHTAHQRPAEETSTAPLSAARHSDCVGLVRHEASALISRNSVPAKLMLISARVIGGVWLLYLKCPESHRRHMIWFYWTGWQRGLLFNKADISIFPMVLAFGIQRRFGQEQQRFWYMSCMLPDLQQLISADPLSVRLSSCSPTSNSCL